MRAAMDRFAYRNGELFCEDIGAEALATAHGTPLYVYSKNGLIDSFSAVSRAFAELSPLIAFSVKSCSSLAVLGVLKSQGAGFDIVSGGELLRARKAGADPRKIVYSGVGKTDAEIILALESDILMFNVESEDELDRLQILAAELGMVAPVALRLNPDVDPRTHAKTTTGKRENKFGVDFASASRIIRNIAEQPNIRLLGLDMHLGSPVNSVDPYRQALEKATDFIRDHRSPRAQLEYLNIGGGFGLLYRDQAVPTFREYAETVIPYIRKAGCRLILEPGRSVAGNNAVLLSRVLYLKDNGVRHFTVIDAGMNDLVRPAMYDAYHFCWPARFAGTPPAYLFRSPEASAYFGREAAHTDSGRISRDVDSGGLRATDVVGPICESSDCFARGRRLPLLEKGALLAVFSAGAYGFSMASNYNSRPRPAEIMVDGPVGKVIREREAPEQLMAGETLF